MQLLPLFVITLLTSFSESKTPPLTQLRGSSSHDDNREHHDNKQHGRLLQTKCGGGVKTTLFKGNITMQSLLRPLQCSAAALNNIGIVLDLVFDDVVKGNQALSSVTLNTTVCTTPIITAPTTGSYFNRFLRAQSTAKYTYRAGMCTTMCWLIISEFASLMSFCLQQVEAAAFVTLTTVIAELASYSSSSSSSSSSHCCHCCLHRVLLLIHHIES